MKKLLVFLSVLVFLVGGMTWLAFAQQDGANTIYATQDEASYAASYWTKERMENAKAFPLPQKEGSPPPQNNETLNTDSNEKPRAVNSGLPADASALMNESEFDSLGYTGTLEDVKEPLFDGYDSYPPPQWTYYTYGGFYGSIYTVFPHKTVGRLFFTVGISNASCTASSIGGRAIITAGHCLCNGAGSFYSNWTFAPAYKNGVRPFGTWTWSIATVLTDYFYYKQYGRDVGYIVLSTLGGLTLSQRVGWLGFASSQSRLQQFQQLGYPADPPYVGKWLVETSAAYAKTNYSDTPATTGKGTTQTGGSSGGPWIIKFEPGFSGAKNYVNGVTSYVYTAQPYTIFSPYFDTVVYDNWYWAITQ